MAIEIKQNISLADYSVFKIGGSAKFFVVANLEEELVGAMDWAGEKSQPVFVLGAGSNILVSDIGFNGLVIKMNLQNLVVSGEKITAGAGVSMARVVNESIKTGLTGFEWGIGVPGTIGGSVRGNAGCFGKEMKDVVERVSVLQIPNYKSQITNKSEIPNFKYETIELSNQECQFGYRESIFKQKSDWIITSAVLDLKRGDPAESKKLILGYSKHRQETQDIGSKCVGCIFKNILWEEVPDRAALFEKFPDLKIFSDRPTLPVSYLIDKAGLKGKEVGNVFVSPKHANFIVNKGGGKAEDVLKLISIIKNAVKDKYGVEIYEEVQLVGF